MNIHRRETVDGDSPSVSLWPKHCVIFGCVCPTSNIGGAPQPTTYTPGPRVLASGAVRRICVLVPVVVLKLLSFMYTHPDRKTGPRDTPSFRSGPGVSHENCWLAGCQRICFWIIFVEASACAVSPIDWYSYIHTYDICLYIDFYALCILMVVVVVFPILLRSRSSNVIVYVFLFLLFLPASIRFFCEST